MGRMMTYFHNTLIATAITAALSLPLVTHADASKPGNCAIFAEMSAETVKKDSRFDGQNDIVPSLMKFAAAQSAKMEAGMAQTYQASKAYGWDKAKVDEMIKQNDAAMRKNFFTSTMDKSKLYMDHVMVVHACAKTQTSPTDLGQSPDAMLATLKKMAETITK